MSLTRRIAGHTFYYGSAQMLVMAAGLVSMPILTRVLSKADYGLMSIINLTVTLGLMTSSCGLRQAIIRLHGEYRTRGVLPEALGTYLACILGLGALGTLVLLAICPALVAIDLIPRGVLGAALLASALVAIRQAFEGVTCIYRAREEVLKFNVYSIATKYVPLALVVVFLLLVSPGLFQYYQGMVIGEAVVLAVLCYLFFRRMPVRSLRFSAGLAREMFRFGLPMMSALLIGIAFHMSNRYIIKLLIGAESVAVYSVAASLAMFATAAIINGFDAALVPVIMNAWAAGEYEKARAALSNLVRYYALGAFPVAAGLIAVRSDVIRLVASKEYLEAAPIVPLVLGASIVWGFYSSLLIGLQIGKRTDLLAALAAVMALLNILLTLTLIPMFSATSAGAIMGAATATLISMIAYIVVGYLLSRRYCKVIIPWANLARYAAAALLMFFCVTRITLSSWLARLAVRIPAGVVIYAVLVLALDRPLRLYVFEQIGRLRKR